MQCRAIQTVFLLITCNSKYGIHYRWAWIFLRCAEKESPGSKGDFSVNVAGFTLLEMRFLVVPVLTRKVSFLCMIFLFPHFLCGSGFGLTLVSWLDRIPIRACQPTYEACSRLRSSSICPLRLISAHSLLFPTFDCTNEVLIICSKISYELKH